ncbi:hypothetical protein [Shewanella acanthi]|uniref:hypothetical protein n=1 Tax=Shewanella acanthi TaxID=2864212 RepID=UPI001C657EEB|nr:hypothetical protein [Shewanella acanthi]QYJ78431.1 hypothetical protein K0H61_15225 [Shewanella acanthi]
MKKALSAALLSALVAPGCGHYYLKHKRTALVFFVLAILSLGMLLADVHEVAQRIAIDIQNGTIPMDTNAIMNEVTAQTHSSMINSKGSMYGFILCWLVAVLDSFRLGFKQDKQDAKAAK